MSDIILINIHAKEWFDRSAGNSYFSCRVAVHREGSTATYFIPFQYGYGDQYRHEALKLLVKEGEVPEKSFLSQFKSNSIKEEGCRKRDVRAWGGELKPYKSKL